MINAEQVAVYGLEDHVEIITPGSSEAVDAELYTIYGKQDPWLGYMWGTGNPAILLDLVRLEEVPYTEACWATDKACGFSESQVLKAVHKSLLPKAPDVVAVLAELEDGRRHLQEHLQVDGTQSMRRPQKQPSGT